MSPVTIEVAWSRKIGELMNSEWFENVPMEDQMELRAQLSVTSSRKDLSPTMLRAVESYEAFVVAEENRNAR